MIGAWLAGSLALVATLAFAAPIAVTAAWLGQPDYGVMAAGAFAAALLLTSFYAVGLFASAAARSEIGAFAIAFAILFALLMFGWDGFGRLFAGAAPVGPVKVAAYASPKFWMERIAAGRVELRAVLYFVGLTALALAGAAAALNPLGRRGVGRSARIAAGGLAGLALAAAAVAFVPSRVALDLTADKRFTLSDGTIDLLRRLPEGSRIDLFWSAGGADIPSAVRAYAEEVAELLRQMADRSDGRLVFDAHDAEPDGERESGAIAAGVRRVPLSSGDTFFLGASFSANGKRVPIPYFDQRRAGQLEYDAATALAGLARTRPPRVAVVTPLLAPGDPNAADVGFNAINELRRAYDVAIVPPFADRLPDGLDAVVVIGANLLKREMLYSIDQAVMRGAGLVAMIDPRLRLAPANDKAPPQPSDDVDDLSDLLAAYGLRYLGDEVVGDLSLATPVADASGRTLSFPYWMRFGGGRISETHGVTAALGDLLFVEPGGFAAPPAAALVST
ncbi:GldG family protein, partial [Hansschlegelia zhihuaiae]